MAHDFEGAVGNHLIGVHVGGSTGAALDHVGGELVVELAVEDFAAGPGDSLELLVGEQSQLVVGDGGTQFRVCQTVDELGIIVEMEF